MIALILSNQSEEKSKYIDYIQSKCRDTGISNQKIKISKDKIA